MRYADLSLKYSQEYRTARDELKRERLKLREAVEEMKTSEEAREVIQTVARTVQAQAHKQVAGLVSRCLAAVFEDAYRFEVRSVKRRGKAEVDMVFVRDGLELGKDGVGGGVLDVAAFALRLAYLCLKHPKNRPIIIADEPFKNINGEENRERASRLLQTLAKDFGIQFIITTGFDWLAAGNKVVYIK